MVVRKVKGHQLNNKSKMNVEYMSNIHRYQLIDELPYKHGRISICVSYSNDIPSMYCLLARLLLFLSTTQPMQINQIPP